MVKDSSRAAEVVSREYTINLGKRLHDIGYKKRAPRAIKAIKAFAEKQMHTKDVRLDVGLNQAVWSRGIRSVPRRLRVVISRKRSEDEDKTDALYSLVTLAEDQTTKGKSVVVLDN